MKPTTPFTGIASFKCPRADKRVTPRLCNANQVIHPEECEGCEPGAPYAPIGLEQNDAVRKVREDGAGTPGPERDV